MRRHVLGILAVLAAVAGVVWFSQCATYAWGVGHFDVRVSFDPPPAADVQVSYTLCRDDVARWLVSEPHPEVHFTSLRLAEDNTASVSVPFSARSRPCLGSSKYTHPFDSAVFVFESQDGTRTIQAVRLPTRDGPREITISRPQPR